ncbi:hypothetical protein AWC09_17875 [Mycolicibacter hiberniae]|nr:hypothetical protein AWC09_17875 [Mycolicibacter hiberniae]
MQFVEKAAALSRLARCPQNLSPGGSAGSKPSQLDAYVDRALSIVPSSIPAVLYGFANQHRVFGQPGTPELSLDSFCGLAAFRRERL